MKTDDAMISEGDLLAYVDGVLDEKRRAAVEAHLAAHPADAETVAAWRRQNDAIAELYHRAIEEPAPARLSIDRIRRSRPATATLWRVAAAIILCLLAGGAGGWYGRLLLAPAVVAQNPLVHEAIAAHSLYASEVVHPVEVRASDKTHLAAWLSKRLDRRLAVPDLKADGFRLIGGRLLPAGDKPAAQFMYENESGRRVTLYIVPTAEGRETSFQFARLDRLETFYWRDETISCALVGDLPRKQLHDLALQTYRQLG
jgi:anti-sigma factor RsiW